MKPLSRLEKKILLHLLQDCTQTVSVIASKIGTTRQTVANKIKSLSDSGIIQGFYAKLNPDFLDLGLRALILIREEPASEFRIVNEEMLKDLPQVSGFYYVFGRHDVVLEVFVKDNEELKRLVKKIHDLNGIKETETMIIHDVVKDNREDPIIEILRK